MTFGGVLFLGVLFFLAYLANVPWRRAWWMLPGRSSPWRRWPSPTPGTRGSV